MTGLIDRMIQWFTGVDMVDLDFVQSNLKDMPVSEADRALLAHMDSHVNDTTKGDDRPIGKQVK